MGWWLCRNHFRSREAQTTDGLSRPSRRSFSLRAHHMNEFALIERVRELRREISEIQSANRDYWSRSQHSQEEKNQK
jgi:hypothetical protein